MAFPPRPRSTHTEPSFAPLGAAPRDALPLRSAVPRPAAKPTANDTGLDREAMRLTAEPRLAPEREGLTLTAADRITVSSAITTDGNGRPRGFFGVLGIAVLIVLAAIGAYSLYQWAGAFLP
ncbi:MAG TPA: hypothetical protein VE397_09120 [Stellaceae bacterium]|jgi:hypothetical protein|nr:hypothetical protein [Stellaceae bacterium]